MNARIPIACVLLAVAGAAVAQEAQAPPGQEATAVVAAAPPTDARVINMILVKVNGTPIFLSELETELETQLSALRAQFPESEIEAQMVDMRRGLLASMIDDRMMMQRADQLQITADANAVDRAIQNLRESSGLATDEEFAAALEANGMTMDLLRESMRKRIRQQQLAFQEVQRGILVTEAEIDRYYDANTTEFEAPERVRIDQLVFVGGPEMEERAAAALADLRSGATLTDVAASFPEASSFPADDTPVAVDDLNESLAAAVPGLAEGRFSDPVRSQFGWHLVRVVERQARSVRPLEEVREAIRNRLTIEKSNERMDAYLGQLRQQTHLQIFAPEFDNMEEFWRAGEEGAGATTTGDPDR